LVTSYELDQQDQSVQQYSGRQEVGKGRGRPKKTRQDTLRDDLQAMDVSWEEAKSVAGDRKEWMEIARRPNVSAGTGVPGS